MMIFLEGRSFVDVFVIILFPFSFRSANAHTESLGEVDVISDAEVGLIFSSTHSLPFSLSAYQKIAQSSL